MTLAERLRELRTQAKLTLAEAGKRAGVTLTYISDLENARTDNPSLAVLRRLALAYGVSAVELLLYVEDYVEREAER